jgi:hypothetical protein
MSYNIDSTEYLSGVLSISLGDWRRLADDLSGELPELTFLNEQDISHGEDHVVVPIEKFWWSGAGSGRSVDLFVEHVAPHLIGEADILLTWEGGDSFSGWRIRDGKVTAHEVVHALGKEIAL